MNYILRQIVPGDSSPRMVIHINSNEVKVGRRGKTSLSRFLQMSRDHAIFYKSDSGALFIKDLDSLNGVYVNDKKIGSVLKPLSVGDRIGFGVPIEKADEGLVCIVCKHPPEQKFDSADGAVVESFGLEIADKVFVSQDSSGCAAVPKMHLKGIPAGSCIVSLIRCDSKAFEWPPDVKIASFKEHINRHSIYSGKRARQIANSDNAVDFRNKYTVNQASPTIEVRRGPETEYFPSCENSSSVSAAMALKKPRLICEFSDRISRSVSSEGMSSEVEEIIYISEDDESSLDFKSSQNSVEIESKKLGECDEGAIHQGNEVVLRTPTELID